MATDYMARAREAAKATGRFHLNGTPCFDVALATTLEALDKAEAERDALRQAVSRFVADWDDGDRADCGSSALLVAHIGEFRALIQPEPDPLVEAIKELDNHGAGFARPEDYADALREALARHNLKIEEAHHG